MRLFARWLNPEKRNLKRQTVLIAALVCALPGCDMLRNLLRPPVVVGSDENRTVVTVPQGKELHVRLRGNSTVAPPDAWQIVRVPNHIRHIDTDAEADSPGATGSSSTWTFRFSAINPGRGDLSFGSGPSQQRFVITVVTE